MAQTPQIPVIGLAGITLPPNSAGLPISQESERIGKAFVEALGDITMPVEGPTAMTLIFPTVHLNGTSRDELMQQLQQANEAIEKAIEALGKAYPHGRDYYAQGPEAINTALKQHRDRVQRLQSVVDELTCIAQDVFSQGGRR